MAAEYGIAVDFEPSPHETARWVVGRRRRALEQLRRGASARSIAEDRDGEPVFLARNAWELERTAEEWPALRFLETHERA